MSAKTTIKDTATSEPTYFRLMSDQNRLIKRKWTLEEELKRLTEKAGNHLEVCQDEQCERCDDLELKSKVTLSAIRDVEGKLNQVTNELWQ